LTILGFRRRRHVKTMNTLSKKHLFLAFPNDTRVGDRVVRYGFAVLACLSAAALTRWIGPFVNHNLFDLFQGAVVVSTWYGGLGPGIVTAGLSIMTLDYFFIPPLNTFTLGPADLVRLLIFGAVALLTSSLSNQLKEAKSELEKAHGELEERIARRTQELSNANRKLTAEVAHRLEAEKAILEISHREQQRLGQDLHDGLSQMLAGVRLMSEELKGKLAGRQLPEAQDAEIIESRLSEALLQADTVSRGLYPVELETEGLMAALEEMAAKVSKMSAVFCRFRCPKPIHVSDTSIATHLYRIAQEATTNAIKNGKAKHVTIRLVSRPPRITLCITDDGIGFGRQVPRKGMGIKIMEYRARMIDADLAIRSRASGWTRVTCAFLSDAG
jgi:signal transduction histidine kinase